MQVSMEEPQFFLLFLFVVSFFLKRETKEISLSPYVSLTGCNFPPLPSPPPSRPPFPPPPFPPPPFPPPPFPPPHPHHILALSKLF